MWIGRKRGHRGILGGTAPEQGGECMRAMIDIDLP